MTTPLVVKGGRHPVDKSKLCDFLAEVNKVMAATKLRFPRLKELLYVLDRPHFKWTVKADKVFNEIIRLWKCSPPSPKGSSTKVHFSRSSSQSSEDGRAATLCSNSGCKTAEYDLGDPGEEEHTPSTIRDYLPSASAEATIEHHALNRAFRGHFVFCFVVILLILKVSKLYKVLLLSRSVRRNRSSSAEKPCP